MHPTENEIAIRFIDKGSELESFCKQIQKSEWLALDTEFLRENTYFPKFCLLQIANTEQVACIDPLAIEDLRPIFDLLYDPRILKIFHSGRQDLEIFFNIRGGLPAPIFDTQLAAPLLGFTEQISYGALVSEMLGINLAKAHTRTDWSKRPLSKAQIRYAANDVLYLAEIYQKMQAQLSELGRLEWLSEDFDALLDPALYTNPPDKAWQRIRSAQNLHGESLALLQSLAHWREQTACRSDIPRNWIVKDEVLIGIARLKPKNPDELASLRGLHERALKRYGRQICDVVETARNNPPATTGFKAKTVRKSPHQEALVNLLTGVAHQIAVEHSLSAATLAPRKELDRLVSGDPDSKLLHGWRKTIAGDRLRAVLYGEKCIAVENGRIKFELRSGPQGTKKNPD